MAESRRPCTVSECGRPRSSNGLCGMHARRLAKHGDVNSGAKLRVNGGPCSFDGCERLSSSTGLCLMHYTRQRRHGDPSVVVRAAPAERYKNRQGYTSIYAPEHPLAVSSGRVYEHRAVLFEKLQGNDSPCHWCGRALYWFPVPPALRLCVDHLDWDRGNNVASNLVPCCKACNTERVKVVQRGEMIHSAKLTAEDVLAIRSSGLPAADLALMYGVSPNHITRLRRGDQWKHLLPAV